MINKIKEFFSERERLAALVLGLVALALVITEIFMISSFGKPPATVDDVPVTESGKTSGEANGSGGEPDEITSGAFTSGEQGSTDGGESGQTAPVPGLNDPTGTSGDEPGQDVTYSIGGDPEETDGATPGQTLTVPGETAASGGGTPSGNGGTTAAGKAKITAAFTAGNTWPDGNGTVTQFGGVVKNEGDSACSSWSVTVDVPSGTEIFGGWNGVYSINGSVLTVKNETYNGEIPAGGSAEIGFQLKSSSVLTLKDGSGTGAPGGGSSGGGNSGGGDAGGGGNVTPGTPPPEYKPSNISGKQGDDWLFAKGNKIVDKNGKEVWITGINWFGYNTGTNTFDGLWGCNLESSLQSIADRGFNMLRIPISVELVKNWQNGSYPKANYNNALNAKLNDMNSLEIFEYVLEVCESVGIKVMIDMHSAETDSMGHIYNVWYKGGVTVEDFYSSLEWLAYRYRDNDTILAYDLKNEPHGKPNESPRAVWNNSTDKDNWKYVAQTAALKVLSQNPDVLVLVEGIEIYPKDVKKNGDYSSKSDADYHYGWWGGNLRGVKDFPVDLGKYQNKLVYSPHDYGPAVYQQPWFYSGYGYDSLMKDYWRDSWFFIYEDKTAPLLIGEWGGYMTEPNLTWMTHMRTLIKNYKLHHTFWCFNENSGDTGGMVGGDWTTWDEAKYGFVKEVLWQKSGKFVGLDHEVPLGSNGIALKDY
ncbi:MAG: cellulase family glycosylhydrolase [Oscillospiraceae bacterium]|jgi:hypothetical protein|nr:cellulase family glycosylhydrolase [Oscillospiraceae bacterium]